MIPASTLFLLLTAATAAKSPPTAAEKRASEAITPDVIRAHVKLLASDLLEGRAPASRGDALAQAYIAAEFESLGLEPAAPGGGYLQKVPLVGITTNVASPLRFAAGGKSVAPVLSRDFVVNAGVPEEQSRIDGAELVFVGFGIVAPEFEWNDYAGHDVRGKVVVIMNNDPEHDPSIFAGKTRLYYGRWTYKYEEAARQGAAAAIIVHTTPSASYPWQVVQTSWAGEQFELPREGEPRVTAKLWLTEDSTRQVLALAGHDLDTLRAKATERGFRAMPLGVSMSVGLTNRVVKTASANVLARLPGKGPKANEAVLVTAHHDHLGVKAGVREGEDNIYNGAVDNATGVGSLLAIARAFAALPERPARSIVFAAVAAEEQGLLGSSWLGRNLPLPAGRIAAAINMDAMNIFGRTRDVVVVGLGKSTLDDVFTGLARWQGREVRPDAFPDRGSYYRSDHFPLAKAGVPSIYTGTGTEFVGRPEGWGRETMQGWQRMHYHQPSDEWRDDIDLSGMVEDARLLFLLAAKVASAPEMPRWRPGDEFEAARRKALDTAAGMR